MERTTGRTRSLLGIALAAVVLTGACASARGSNADPGGPDQTSNTTPPLVLETTPQPAAESIPQPVVTGLSLAPESKRVDLPMPTFSNPMNVSNPLFPVSMQESYLQLGTVDGLAFRAEVTLLPEPRIIEWNGQQVESLVSQYVAYLGGRIHEVAYDFYAQDDNGAVWYFGEDVFNFRDGVIVDTHGTWIAGKDGPAAMIMPADPQVGDAYRPENIPGLVFEEVTVKSTGQTVEGPTGRVEGAIVVRELHMDGQTERKTFAPGYGEFFTGVGRDSENLAVAVPNDAVSAPVPAELETLRAGALDAFDSAGSRSWKLAASTLDRMIAAWGAIDESDVPPVLGAQMTEALDELARMIEARGGDDARQSAIDAAQAALDAAQAALDLELQYRSPAEIDLARFDLWAAQLLVDAAKGDAGAINGDFFTLDYIRDRIARVLDDADRTGINTQLEELGGAVGDADFAASIRSAELLREMVAALTSAA
jgi:hypothetical protein